MGETKVVEHGEASRLPEPRWGWRRLLIYVVTFWAMAMTTWAVWRVIGIANKSVRADELPVLGAIIIVIRYGFYTAWGALVLYGVGASVTDVAQLASAVRTTRRETIKTDTFVDGDLPGLGGPRP